ncbi:MAG: ATP-binding protein, partial [Eubacteriales bacterium]
TIALAVLLTVALISILSNFFIDRQFTAYILKQQGINTQEIADNVSSQYNIKTKTWDVNFVHAIGMTALNDGYIIKVYDSQKKVVWDAENCDTISCSQVMDDISNRMMQKYPQMNGKFTSKTISLLNNNEKIGTVNIRYYGPYFLSENDFQFLNALNTVLIIIGIFSLAFSVVIGFFMAKRLSNPILKTAGAAKQIADGNYDVRIEENTNTKELSELTSSINHLADSLGKQEALRKQLTADVAHELRTPLTSVGTHLEAMVDGIWEPTPERLQSCHEEVLRIGKIVQELESLAKVESENFKLDKTAVNPAALAQKAVSSFEAEIKNKNLQVSVEGQCSNIQADKDRLSQVFINLLSNAVKYTPEGGNIKITVSETDRNVSIKFQDNGAGIDGEELPFVFERFYRADKSRNRSTGGSGIGLAIVKSIVTAHGGTVEVQSKLNEGTCFTVTLPK